MQVPRLVTIRRTQQSTLHRRPHLRFRNEFYVGNKKYKEFVVTFVHQDAENHKTNKRCAMLESYHRRHLFFTANTNREAVYFVLSNSVLELCVLTFYGLPSTLEQRYVTLWT